MSSSPTVSHGVSDEPASWKTICAPPSASTTRPEVTGLRPAIARRRVDFPDPLSPTIETASPGMTVRSTPRSAWTSRRLRPPDLRTNVVCTSISSTAGRPEFVVTALGRGSAAILPCSRISPAATSSTPAASCAAERISSTDRQQARSCSAPDSALPVIGGCSTAHSSTANGQREWYAHPRIRSSAEAVSRRSVRRGRLRGVSSESREPSRPTVYGCVGRCSTCDAVPTSAIRPA